MSSPNRPLLNLLAGDFGYRCGLGEVSGTDHTAGLAPGTAYGVGVVLGMAQGLPLTHSGCVSMLGRISRAGMRAE